MSDVTDLHTLLDDLTHGEHVKATWKIGLVEITTEGPVHIHGSYCECHHTIRWGDGEIHESFVSIEVTRDEEVTATRVDEERLHALLDSLTDGQDVTAEWRSDAGTMIITGTTMSDGAYVWVRGPSLPCLRSYSGELHYTLHSVTVRRHVVKRWERDGDEVPNPNKKEVSS